MGTWGVGSPNCLLLDQWGAMVEPIFGQPYLVGSAAVGTTWRDVDVRVVMEDDEYDRIFDHDYAVHGPMRTLKWSGLMTAISLWGQKMTGLPIDFQVQRRSDVTEAMWEKPRWPIGMFPQAFAP